MTRSHTTRAAVAAAALFSLLLAGCGGDADPEAAPAASVAAEPAGNEGGKEAFVAEANELCTNVNANINGVFEDVQGPPGPEQMGEVATFGRSFVEDLRALDVPEGDEAVIEEALATYDEALDSFEAAADATDQEAGIAAAEEATALVTEADAALADYGIDACQATSGASAGPPGDDAADAGATEVSVTLDEYSFEVEPTLTAGPTAFALDNVGEEEHEMVLYKFVEGATIDDALAAEQAGEDPEEYFEGPPELGVVGPGEQTFVNTELIPGNYALLCFIPDSEGVPHVAKGMVTGVEVTGEG